MSSSTPPSLVGKANESAPQVPPSGGGYTRENAECTEDFSKDPSQPSYTVFRMLDTPRYIRCTHAKPMKWQAKGFEVVSEATGRKLCPASEALSGPHDTAAFTRNFDAIADTERALGAVGQEAAQEEGLTAGTTEETPVASAQQTESPSSKPSSSSKSSGAVFDKPEVSKGAPLQRARATPESVVE